MIRYLCTAVVVILCLAMMKTALAVPPKCAIEEGKLVIKGVSPDCPMIYDNDWWIDVADAAYLWTKASQGKCDLKGNIVSRDMWDWRGGYTYKMKQCLDECEELREVCERSGLDMSRVPEPTLGAGKALQRPSSGKIGDTKFTRTPGSDLIVKEAKAASEEEPLLVFVGGPCTTVAQAYLTDPAIVDRMVVFQIDGGGYNGKDAWSWQIVMQRCRFANWAKGYFWGDVSAWNAKRFDELPRSPLGDLMRKYANSKLGHANQWGDGPWIFYTFDRSCIAGVEPWADQAITVPKGATRTNRMEQEFFRTMTSEKRK